MEDFELFYHASLLKNFCINRTKCRECPFYDPTLIFSKPCILKEIPANWDIEKE